MLNLRYILLAAFTLFLGVSSSAPAMSQSIIKEWTSVKAPPPPEVKSVELDASTTALIMADFVKQACNEKRRPRCLASVPTAAQFLALAKTKGVFVIYTGVKGGALQDTLSEVFPKDNEPFVESGVDKFFQTNLEQLLKDKGIKTVIVAGTGSNGAVLYTASSAAMRGLKVVIPLDLVSDVDLYTEQYIAYHFTKVPVLAGSIVLTRSDLIK
jgi:nicotinamidase-related amidase